MTLHYQYSTRQTQLDFIRIASSEWQQEAVCRHSQIREGSKTHMIFNLPESKWDLHSSCGKAESSLGVKRELLHVVITPCSAQITLNQETLNLPGFSGSSFIAELPTRVKAQMYFVSEQIYLTSPKCSISK